MSDGPEKKINRAIRLGVSGFLIVFFMFAVSACGRLAPVKPASPTIHEDIDRYCRNFFPESPRQFVQSLTAYLPNDEISNAIGIINVYPETGKIKCVIMGVEGVVIFSGEYDREPVIHKAVPPLDSMKFAGALFEDIRLAFLPPAGQVIQTGTLSSGIPVRRYELNEDKGYVDLIFPEEGRLKIKKYSRRKKRLKTIDACYAPRCEFLFPGKAGAGPVRLEIIHHGILGYRLELMLIRTEALPAE